MKRFLQHPQILHHECGFSYVHLKKDFHYYQHTYENGLWGLSKTRLLLEKQRNRGQDGAGIAAIHKGKDGAVAFRIRETKPNAIDKVFEQAYQQEDIMLHSSLFLGHVRYSTYGKNDKTFCQPFIHNEKNPQHRLTLAGNFNLTNITQLKEQLPLHHRKNNMSDTYVLLKTIAHYLQQKQLSTKETLAFTLKKATQDWDGGYAFCGVLGTGDTFLFRDPAGIRPAFLYHDNDVVAAASERAALITAFNCEPDAITPLEPGSITFIDTQGTITQTDCIEKKRYAACSFESIYFSRQEDPAIYKQRKALGKQLAPRVIKALGNNLKGALFCHIPNTSIVAYSGMVEAIQKEVIAHASTQKTEPFILHQEPLISKNQKLRTFISEGNGRQDLVEHMYNVTKGIVQPDQTIVAVDDSIVRGLTLQQSVMRNLMNLSPKQIIIVSSAPPIIYPDCYGIDMSKFEDFVGFRALINLVHQHGYEHMLKEIEDACTDCLENNKAENPLQRLYGMFTQEQLEEEIARLIRPHDIDWHGEIKVIYQTIQDMHTALDNTPGDWYFTGNYPTPGGYKVVNKSYLQWRSGSHNRAY